MKGISRSRRERITPIITSNVACRCKKGHGIGKVDPSERKNIDSNN